MFIRILAATAAVLLVVACSDDAIGPGENSVVDFIAAVRTVEGETATLRRGEPPAEGSGPTLMAASQGEPIVGGSTLMDLQAPHAFTSVMAFVEGREGYYEVTLASGANETTLVVTLSQTVNGSFRWVFAGVDANGNVGQYAANTVTPVQVGTGDVQVSVSWDSPSDVDLYVVEPSGAPIYWQDPSSATGGCSISTRTRHASSTA